jgi:hypothetical protein
MAEKHKEQSTKDEVRKVRENLEKAFERIDKMTSSPVSQAYVDYCKEMHNELPRAYELTHAEKAQIELHLAHGGDRAKVFEIIQEAGKRYQREAEERQPLYQEAVDQLNRALAAAEVRWAAYNAHT